VLTRGIKESNMVKNLGEPKGTEKKRGPWIRRGGGEQGGKKKEKGRLIEVVVGQGHFADGAAQVVIAYWNNGGLGEHQKVGINPPQGNRQFNHQVKQGSKKGQK